MYTTMKLYATIEFNRTMPRILAYTRRDLIYA